VQCAGPQRFQKPQVRTDRELNYPLSAQLDKIEGDVLIGVFVNVEGKAETVKIFESSGHAQLDSAAVQFANSIEYDPALLDGNKIASWTKLLLKYKLTEVAFDKDVWQDAVRRYYRNIREAETREQVNLAEQRLYLQFLGLVNYVEKYDDVLVNETIRQVVSKQSYQNWQEFWTVIPVPFVAMDDFYTRFPNSEIKSKIRNELVRSLIDAESKIRFKAFKSPRFTRKSLLLLEKLSNRIDELQEDLNQETFGTDEK